MFSKCFVFFFSKCFFLLSVFYCQGSIEVLCVVSVEALCMECSLCAVPLEGKGVLFPPVRNYLVAYVRFYLFI